jgi:hypothetical protein
MPDRSMLHAAMTSVDTSAATPTKNATTVFTTSAGARFDLMYIGKLFCFLRKRWKAAVFLLKAIYSPFRVY